MALEHYLYLRDRAAFVGAPVRRPQLTLVKIIIDAGEEPPKRPTGDDAYSAVIRAWDCMSEPRSSSLGVARA